MSDQHFAINGESSITAGTDNWRGVNRLDLDLLDQPQQYEIFDPGLVEAINTALGPVSYTHLTLPTNREV